MGRYFTPAQSPQFIEGMYTPPWELINKKLEAEQTGFDNTLNTTNIMKNVDIKHIADPVLYERVNEIKNYYTQKIEKIEEDIKKDPTSWRKYIPDIQGVGKEMTKDMTTGEIANMKESYEGMKSMIEAHKEYKELYPEYYNQGMTNFISEFQKDPLRKKPFTWHQLAKPINAQEVYKAAQGIKPSAKAELENGRIITTTGVPQAQIETMALNMTINNPENAAFIQQQVKFKNPQYYNAKYAELNDGNGFYTKLYKDPHAVNKENDNDIISDVEARKKFAQFNEDYDKYIKDYNAAKDDKERAKLIVPKQEDYVITQNGAVGSIIEGAKNAGFYSQIDIKQDSAGLARVNMEYSRLTGAIDRQLRQKNADFSQLSNATNSLLKMEESYKSQIEDIDTEMYFKKEEMNEITNKTSPEYKKLEEEHNALKDILEGELEADGTREGGLKKRRRDAQLAAAQGALKLSYDAGVPDVPEPE